MLQKLAFKAGQVGRFRLLRRCATLPYLFSYILVLDLWCPVVLVFLIHYLPSGERNC